MKRALVEYASSEEETTPANEKQKKRKLPALSSSLTVPAPVDDPALHQGRVRAVPHVQGQYAAHIYLPIVLHPKDALSKLISEALALATAHVPSLHAIGNKEDEELHISLSRPLFLRAHQREEFKRAIKQVASSIAPFDASFTTFSELTNDERTRTFLVLEVGAGHRELRRCLDLLAPTLALFRQKEFYLDPKFHTSIAWALLEKASPPPVDDIALPELSRIAHFPHALVSSLNEAYAAKLSQARTGGFLADRIAVKIGKDVVTWPLIGMRYEVMRP